MRKLKEVLNGDFRVEGVKEDAQLWLKKIKILDKVTPENEDVSIDSLDKLLVKMMANHNIIMQWISIAIMDDNIPYYNISFKDRTTHEWLGSLYGITIYEIYCKSVLFCYAKIKSTKGDE